MTGSSTEALSGAFAAHARSHTAEPTWLTALRNDAFARFSSLGVPTRADEEWKYTSLRGFDAAPWELGPGETTFHCAHVIPGVRISSLADVVAQRPELLHKLLAKAAQAPRAFDAASAAFLGTGLVIELCKGVHLPEPIRVHHAARGGAFFPRLFVFLGPGAEAEVVETFAPNAAPDGARAFTGSVTDIHLSENAILTYTRVQTDAPNAFHISSSRATLARAARMVATGVTFGGQVSRNDIDIQLAGEGADATLDGFYMVNGKRHVDNHTTIDHMVPHTKSSQHYKGILGGESRGVFNGKVFVRRDAQKTDAYQLNQNLLLSSDAEIDTKPQLEIDADDVKCAHGAAVGQLNADEIFYLQSRGIARAEAERLLSLGFADEILFKVLDTKLRDELRRYVKDSLAP